MEVAIQRNPLPVLKKMPAIGIIRGVRIQNFQQMLPIYVEAGFRAIEITLNTAHWDTMIQYAKHEFPGILSVGAGTVCNKEELNQAITAGAEFIVTPVVVEEIIRTCVSKQLPVFPGAFSPTEVYTAWQYGASMVKLYPAGRITASYISDLKAPFPQVRIMPTGGIGYHNLQEYIHAGADAFGLGTGLFPPELINGNDQQALFRHFQKVASLVQQISKKYESS